MMQNPCYFCRGVKKCQSEEELLQCFKFNTWRRVEDPYNELIFYFDPYNGNIIYEKPNEDGTNFIDLPNYQNKITNQVRAEKEERAKLASEYFNKLSNNCKNSEVKDSVEEKIPNVINQFKLDNQKELEEFNKSQKVVQSHPNSNNSINVSKPLNIIEDTKKQTIKVEVSSILYNQTSFNSLRLVSKEGSLKLSKTVLSSIGLVNDSFYKVDIDSSTNELVISSSDFGKTIPNSGEITIYKTTLAAIGLFLEDKCQVLVYDYRKEIRIKKVD